MTERDIEGRKPYEKPAVITIKVPPHVVEMFEAVRALRAEADKLELLALELAKAEAET